ncbi:MAG: MMPL family transporter, partial [Planctomycetaceae bacterium]
GDLTAAVDKTVREETSRVAGTQHVVTGMVPLFLQTQQAVLSSLIQSFILAFIVIGAVICYLLGSLRAGLATMLPNVLPISTVFGAISWFGIRVDIGTMITASVALGIAVDGTLHLLTWFRNGIANGRTRRVAISEALNHCGPALCQTSFAVSAGLLVLFPAELSLISRFGWLMAAMITAALFADLVFLPSLLAGRLGWWIMNADVARTSAGAQTDAALVPTDQTSIGTGNPGDSAEKKTETDPQNPSQLKAPHMLRSTETASDAGPGNEIA